MKTHVHSKSTKIPPSAENSASSELSLGILIWLHKKGREEYGWYWGHSHMMSLFSVFCSVLMERVEATGWVNAPQEWESMSQWVRESLINCIEGRQLILSWSSRHYGWFTDLLLMNLFGEKTIRISINKWICVVQGMDCSECFGVLPKSLFRSQGLISLCCCNCCWDTVLSSQPSQQIASTKDKCQTHGHTPPQPNLQALTSHLEGKNVLVPHSIGQLRGIIPALAGLSGAFLETTWSLMFPSAQPCFFPQIFVPGVLYSKPLAR